MTSIWNNHEKCIEISTNIPAIGLLVREIIDWKPNYDKSLMNPKMSTNAAYPSYRTLSPKHTTTKHRASSTRKAAMLRSASSSSNETYETLGKFLYCIPKMSRAIPVKNITRGRGTTHLVECRSINMLKSKINNCKIWTVNWWSRKRMQISQVYIVFNFPFSLNWIKEQGRYRTASQKNK